ncbi:MAG: GNAT family N-acetyltransferase [Rubrobacteraceae bacterium]|nr:GNAT family N-acetyltransferase [Rubrobacteraceae bacterium]
MTPVEVISATSLAEPLALLEEFLRDGEPVSEDFANRLRRAIQAGVMEVLAALAEGRIVGVLVLAYRLNVSASGHFASIEDLYVRPEARRQGVASALLEAVNNRCSKRDISYVEVQVEDDAAEAFYAALGYEPEGGVRVLSRSLAISYREPEG